MRTSTFDTGNSFDIRYLLQLIADGADVVDIMHVDLQFPIEDAGIRRDGQSLDVHVQLTGEDLGKLIEDAYAVDARKLYIY